MWESVKLKDIALIKGGKRIPKGKKLTDAITPFPYLRVSDFGDNGTINISNLKYVPESVYPEIKNYTIHSDDVYISIAGTIGKVGIIPEILDGANLTENAAKLVLGDNCFNKYIALVLSSKHVTKQIKESTRTATQPKLSLQRMGEISIPLPPLAEQQRIVAKLDAAFAEIDRAITTSKAQAVNISSLKRKFISNALTIDVQAKPLGDCCAFLNGYAFKSGDAVETSETQLLRMGNLYENRLDLERKPVFYPDEYANQHSRYVLANDDIVMTLTGTVGKQDYGYALKIGDTEKTLLLNQRILKLYDFNSTVINQEYLLYFLQSESFLAELYATANGTRQANLSSDTIKKLKIPVPSLDKQEKAVAAFKLMDDYHHQFFECLMEKISNLSTLKSALLAQELKSEAA